MQPNAKTLDNLEFIYNHLTPKTSLLLINECFETSMPKSSLACSSLQESRDERIHRKCTVDQLQKEMYALFSTLPKDIAQEAINNQFQQIEKRLLNDERHAWKNLIQYSTKICEFDETVIPSFDAMKKYSRAWINQKWACTGCGNDVPQEWKSLLIKAMADNDVSANNINIIMSSLTPFAWCISPSSDKPGTIALNKNYYKKNYSTRQKEKLSHTAFHEVTHLIQGHYLMFSEIFEIMLLAKTTTDESYLKLATEITNSPAYISFILSQERSADFLLGLKNSHLTRHARHCGLPHSLYPGSYNYLALIDTHTRALELITTKKWPNATVEELATTLMSIVKSRGIATKFNRSEA